MDQPGENWISTSDEARDSSDESQKGFLGPALIVAGVLCVCAVILLWPMGTLRRPKAGSLLEPATAGSPAQETVAQRPPLQYYHAAIPGGLFHAPQPPAPQPRRLSSKPPVRIRPAPTIQMPIAPINPYADWVYTGAVKRGSRIMALLEHTRTKEGQYVVAGDRFENAQVESITEQMVTLQSAGKRYTIPKSEAISVIALDKNAPYLANGVNGQPGVTPPPAPGATPAPPAQAQPQPNGAENADSNSDQSADSSDQ